MRTLVFWLLALFPALLFAAGSTPTRETVERHIDSGVKVYGNYAAVKLPLNKGVPLHNPTVVALGPGGTIYGANYTGEIFRLIDTDGDGLEDTAALFADVKNDALRYPTGMVFKGKDLYVATTQEIRIYRDTNGDGIADQSETFARGWPFTMHNFDWTFAPRFGPDGSLYFILCTDYYVKNQGTDPQGLRGSLLRTVDGKKLEVFCNGMRFPYGMAFNPAGDIFFSDNKGNENPTEELNHAKQGRFYGNNPKKFPNHPPETRPILDVKYGFGMGGIAFNPPDNSFGDTAGDLFISCWGPDGAWTKGSITRVRLKKDADGNYKADEYRFADGPAKMIELVFGSTGDLYVARFGIEGSAHTPNKSPEGNFYRFIHAPWVTPAVTPENAAVATGNPSEGRKHFESLQCAACHALDPKTEMLGPDLGDVGLRLSRLELVEAINDPCKVIKTGFEQQVFTTKEQGVLSGRVVASTDAKIDLLIPGNKRVTIKRENIVSSRTVAGSLMPQDLIKAATPRQIDDLLAYLLSLRTAPIGASSGEGHGSVPESSKAKAAAPSNASGFSWNEEEGNALGLSLNGKPIWKMQWSKDQKPFLHPLATADGVPLSWLSPSDHIWHRAVWFSWKFINKVNYWEENRNGIADGLTEVSSVKAVKNPDRSARFAMDVIYHLPGKENLMTEKRAVVVYPPQPDGSYRMDWSHSFTACADLTLDRTPPPGKGGPQHGGYAGFSYRAAKELSEFQVLDSEGRRNMEGHGKSAQWMAFSGVLKEQNNRVATVAIFDHSANPRHPSPWFIVMNKGFGYFSPAFVFNEPYEMKSGQTLTLNYRLMVADGLPDTKKLNEEFRLFSGIPSKP